MERVISTANPGCLRAAFIVPCLLMSLLLLGYINYTKILSYDSAFKLSIRRARFTPHLNRRNLTPFDRTPDSRTASKSNRTINCGMPGKQMTIVSGYLNIGSFRKGRSLNFTTDKYLLWARRWGYVDNPLVFYTDDPAVADFVKEARSKPKLQNCTYIQVVNRSELWGFELIPNISAVINQPKYPKFHPNTVIPAYAAVMHSKFAMLEMAIEANFFETEYIAWADTGLFRAEAKHTDQIELAPPPALNRSRVAANQIDIKVVERSVKDIFYSERFWFVGGGYFIAEKAVMLRWCWQYRNFTEYLLRLGYSNSDQQVIYAMFTEAVRKSNDSSRPSIEIEIEKFAPPTTVAGGSWYHLRWLSQDEGKRYRARLAADAFLKNVTSPSAYLRAIDDTEIADSNVTALPLPPVCDTDTTVVLSYFSFGTMAMRAADGSIGVRDSGLYSSWLSQLAQARNPVVAYFDCPVLRQRFADQREKAGLTRCTTIELLDRDTLWGWRALPWLNRALRKDEQKQEVGAIPEYLASLHSKFELLGRAVTKNRFNTTRFAWLDSAIVRQRQSAADGKVQLQPFSVSTGNNESNVIEFVSDSELTHSSLTRVNTSVQAQNASVGGNGTGTGSQDEQCSLPVSTTVLIGEREAMRMLSRAYRLAAEITLAWGKPFFDFEVLQALYCWRNVSEVVRRRFGKTLPILRPSRDLTKSKFFTKLGGKIKANANTALKVTRSAATNHSSSSYASQSQYSSVSTRVTDSSINSNSTKFN